MSSTIRRPRWPTPAETARTLASGVVPGTLLLPAQPRQPESHVRVHSYVTATSGEIHVLADDATEAGERLRTAVGQADGLDVAALLDLLDVPPVRTDLPRARLCVAGWVEPLGKDEQRAAALDVASARPASSLLSVGHTATLYRLQPAELALTRGDATYDVDVDDFRSVEADPVYENEHEVAGHLQQYHYDDLTQWALARLAPEERRTLRQVTITGIDRYGLDLSCVTAPGCTRPRVTFGVAVPHEDALGEALQELNQCGACEPPGVSP